MRAIVMLVLLAGCSTVPSVPEVRIQKETVEVARPCAVTVPVRPAPLARPLPSDSVALAALLGGKLSEYAGPGAYADRAEAAIKICTSGGPFP